MAVLNQWQINGANPVTVGGTGITAKYFTQPSGNFTQGPSTTPNSTNATGQLAVRADNQLNGQQFHVIAAGNFEVGAGGACPSFTLEMVANTGTPTSPTYTVIASSTAITVQANLGVFYPWQMEAYINGDTLSGTINGHYDYTIDNTYTSNQALKSVLSGLNFFSGGGSTTPPVVGVGLPVFGIVMRVTFGVSEPGNSANMYQFQIFGS
jgi:hypothetical protein